MKVKLRVIEFKSIEPFFSQERDGTKPFTIRQVDRKDPRFRALARWPGWRMIWGPLWVIKSTNPATGESFLRELTGTRYMPGGPTSDSELKDWLILYLGKEVKES